MAGVLSGLKDRVVLRIGQQRDLTVAELAGEIAATHGTTIHRGSVWRVLRELGLTHKERPSRRRAEAARGSGGAPHLHHPSSALHGQLADADRLY